MRHDGAVAWVDVWVRRAVDVPGGQDLLDDHEHARLASAVAPGQARAYAAAHVLARRAVAQVAGGSPAQLRFDRTCPACGEEHGRPTLPDLPDVWVSLSRTEEVVAVAVSGLPVGVDVESGERARFTGFAAVALHPGERAEDPARSWTRKEAALKALGTGLRTDPTSLRTPPDGIPTDLGDGAWVTVRDVPVPWPGHAVAVAVAGRADPLEIRMR